MIELKSLNAVLVMCNKRNLFNARRGAQSLTPLNPINATYYSNAHDSSHSSESRRGSASFSTRKWRKLPMQSTFFIVKVGK